MVRVKMCGITSAEDARLCVEAGADALGFIFVEKTPRFVTPAQARAIIATLPPFVTPVGVFWDHPAGHVKAVAEECGLAALQFHGDEAPEDVAQHRLPVIKTIKVEGPDALARIGRHAAAAYLLDSPARWSEGEARAPISWDVAKAAAAAGHRIVLSAGLTPENVGAAVAAARPFAVDVNSGVEARPGVKDPDKVRRFIAAARGA
ncbi:MAG TPA: phosphoribosylanthranilate isomerase [Methylomirabilota bacterium]|nr:phosphoribosylanthranilate isomerase [Methylomirabilota bacterium]